jgi:hypothetical protein
VRQEVPPALIVHTMALLLKSVTIYHALMRCRGMGESQQAKPLAQKACYYSLYDPLWRRHTILTGIWCRHFPHVSPTIKMACPCGFEILRIL